MHPALALLEEVTALLGAEEEALAQEDLERVEELSSRRAAVLNDVWQMRQGCDETVLHDALAAVLQMNKTLTAKAEALEKKYQQQQQMGRKQTKYFSTERHLHSAMRKSIYCDAKT